MVCNHIMADDASVIEGDDKNYNEFSDGINDDLSFIYLLDTSTGYKPN